MSMVVGGYIKNPLVAVEDRVKRQRKKNNAYECYEIGMVD